MASKLIGIVGATGTGKSTSIKHLDPKETYIINVAKKELPFKGAEKLYNSESKNYKEVDDANEITRLLRTISEKAPRSNASTTGPLCHTVSPFTRRKPPIRYFCII